MLPSMRQDRVYRTWISVVKETAKVFSADCSCTVGQEKFYTCKFFGNFILPVMIILMSVGLTRKKFT